MGIGGIKKSDTEAARLHDMEMSYDIFKTAIEMSNSLPVLKANLLRFDKMMQGGN